MQVYELRRFATNGIRINDAISRIRLLKNATLPTDAPARFPIVTPARLYQPSPPQIEIASLIGYFIINPHTAPPISEPMIIPSGIISIFTLNLTSFERIPLCLPTLILTENISRYRTHSE